MFILTCNVNSIIRCDHVFLGNLTSSTTRAASSQTESQGPAQTTLLFSNVIRPQGWLSLKSRWRSPQNDQGTRTCSGPPFLLRAETTENAASIPTAFFLSQHCHRRLRNLSAFSVKTQRGMCPAQQSRHCLGSPLLWQCPVGVPVPLSLPEAC